MSPTLETAGKESTLTILDQRTSEFASIEASVVYPLDAESNHRVLGHARHSENESNYLVIYNPATLGPAFLVRTADRALDTDPAYSWHYPLLPSAKMDDTYKIRLGRYRHYKGKTYLVLGVAVDVDDENYEPLVVYVPLYEHEGHAIAIRPKEMFEGFVETESDFPPQLTDEFPNLAKPSRQQRFRFIPY